jgi:hypothetical protein
MARQPDLGALRVADHHEGRPVGATVPGEPAGAETQILAVLDDEGAGHNPLPHPGARRGHDPQVVALAVSTEVARRLPRPRALVVLGVVRGAVHLDLDGFVVSLTGPGVPWMPNGVAVARPHAAARVVWDRAAPPLWDPAVPPLAGGPPALAELAGWLLARVRPPDIPLGDAAERLVGRGPGLTPAGDDTLAGAAIGLRALGPAAGLDAAEIDRSAATLCPPDLRARTGALSATLLEMAARSGAAPEPAHRLLGSGDRTAALAELRALGASTGGALAAGIALAARHLTASTRQA